MHPFGNMATTLATKMRLFHLSSRRNDLRRTQWCRPTGGRGWFWSWGRIQGCSMPDIMRISFLLCVLLLFSAPSLAEESDGAAMIAIQLAGFVTTHDVAEHSFIDKDIKDMSTEMAKKTQIGYDAALKIYQEGKNSRMQTKARTLDEFWPGMHVNTQGHKATEEPFLKMYDEYEKLTKHASAHKGAVAAMQGTDNAQELGINYATDKNAKTWPFRDQVAKKNIKYQVVMVFHPVSYSFILANSIQPLPAFSVPSCKLTLSLLVVGRFMRFMSWRLLWTSTSRMASPMLHSVTWMCGGHSMSEARNMGVEMATVHMPWRKSAANSSKPTPP